MKPATWSWIVAAPVLSLLLSAAAPAQCVSTPPNGVSWWPADETGGGTSGDIIDSNPGTLRNGAYFTPGLVCNALQFDGLDDDVRVNGNAPNLDITGSEITVETWVYPTGLPGDNSIVWQQDKYELFLHSIDGDDPTAGYKLGGQIATLGLSHVELADTPIISRNAWTHVALVYQQPELRLYVNGSLADSVSFGSLTTIRGSNFQVVIGRSTFRGMIDEVTLYDRALTTAEVLGIYTAGPSGKCKPSPDSECDGYPDGSDNCPMLANPQQSNQDGDALGDVCDPCPGDPSGQCDTSNSASGEIPAAGGGEVSSPGGGITITVPPGSLASNTTISATHEIPADPSVIVVVGSGAVVGEGVSQYVLLPNGTTFDPPAELRLSADVSELSVDERDNLDLYLFSDAANAYVSIGAVCTVDESPPGVFEAECTALISHFSNYAMAGHSTAAATIPAVSEWGMVVLGLLVLTSGTLIVRRGGMPYASALVAFSLLAPLFSAPTTRAQSGGAYAITKSTIDSGGHSNLTDLGGTYRLGGTVGQHDAVELSGGNYLLAGGFWSPAAPAGELPPEIDWNPDPLSAERTSRSLIFSVDPPATASATPGQSAIKVTMVDLQNPNPPNLLQYPPPDFSAYELGTCGDPGGCARWVGKPGTFREAQDDVGLGLYRAARLQCTPFYYDWVTETASTPIAVVGAEIAPSSEYRVQTYGASCKGLEGSCTNVSAAVTMYTRRSGDVEAPFNPPATSTQPNATDIAQIVAKVKNVVGALPKSRAQLQPNLPEQNADLNALDIVAVVDAVKQFAYAFGGPCPCPSTVQCGPGGASVPCTSPTVCVTNFGSGAACVKTCLGGDNDGDPCINNGHCSGGGTCTNGFCRDRCGRCTP